MFKEYRGMPENIERLALLNFNLPNILNTAKTLKERLFQLHLYRRDSNLNHKQLECCDQRLQQQDN
jgi:hypothetical protein